MHLVLQPVEHEQATIRAFVVPDKQERFLGFLAKPKTRSKFLEQLNYFRYFDRRFAFPLAFKGDSEWVADICRLLQSKGAGRTCWVMSEIKTLDGREVDLQWVIGKVIGTQMGSIFSCVPGKLALYVGEDEMFVLSR
jgi:hypothetical protein